MSVFPVGNECFCIGCSVKPLSIALFLTISVCVCVCVCVWVFFLVPVWCVTVVHVILPLVSMFLNYICIYTQCVYMHMLRYALYRHVYMYICIPHAHKPLNFVMHDRFTNKCKSV